MESLNEEVYGTAAYKLEKVEYLTEVNGKAQERSVFCSGMIWANNEDDDGDYRIDNPIIVYPSTEGKKY